MKFMLDLLKSKMFNQFLIVPMFSALTDPADNRAPLAALPLCHPHLC